MQLSQPLSEVGIVRSYALAMEFGALLEDSLGALHVTEFSYKTHFHVDGYAACSDTITTLIVKS
jgi:hypothetical protein